MVAGNVERFEFSKVRVSLSRGYFYEPGSAVFSAAKQNNVEMSLEAGETEFAKTYSLILNVKGREIPIKLDREQFETLLEYYNAKTKSTDLFAGDINRAQSVIQEVVGPNTDVYKSIASELFIGKKREVQKQ